MTTKAKTKTAVIDTIELREAFRKLNFVPTYKPLPITSHALVEFKDGKATLTATNTEQVIRVELDCVNPDDFTVLLPKKTTEKFLAGGNGKLTIALDEAHNQITLSRDDIGELNLIASRVDDFPPNLPKPDNLEWKPIDGKWLCSMLRIVSTACATEESRPILTGVACNDGSIAAADGFRLKVLDDSRLDFGLGLQQANIPLSAILILDKVFRRSETIEVAFDYKETPTLGATRVEPNHAHFKSGNTIITTQVILGKFPDYRQLIPKEYQCKASFSTPVLSQRLNLIDDKVVYHGIVRYKFVTNEKGMQECIISSGNDEDGQYNLTCPIKFEGADAKIAFNYKYITDAIKPFSICSLEINNPSSPGKLTGDIEGLTVVVMPMFVQW